MSTADTVVVPPGYTARVLIAWGDPVSDGPAFKHDASNSAADQASSGACTTTASCTSRSTGSKHGLLVQNNEYTDDVLLFPDGIAELERGEDAKSQQRPRRVDHRDRSAVEARGNGKDESKVEEWRVVRPSPYARRITGADADHDRRPAPAGRADRRPETR